MSTYGKFDKSLIPKILQLLTNLITDKIVFGVLHLKFLDKSINLVKRKVVIRDAFNIPAAFLIVSNSVQLKLGLYSISHSPRYSIVLFKLIHLNTMCSCRWSLQSCFIISPFGTSDSYR